MTRYTEHPGLVAWITGLSGAGKSTVARAVIAELAQSGIRAILLDGDEVRAAISDANTGHDTESRLKNAMRICRWAALLSKQGFMVVVATMSLFEEVHRWNRDNLPSYREIFLDVGLDTLHKRDPRGLYRRASSSEEKNVVGIDLNFSPPKEPHLTVRNDAEGLSPQDSARKILDFIEESFRCQT